MKRNRNILFDFENTSYHGKSNQLHCIDNRHGVSYSAGERPFPALQERELPEPECADRAFQRQADLVLRGDIETDELTPDKTESSFESITFVPKVTRWPWARCMALLFPESL